MYWNGTCCEKRKHYAEHLFRLFAKVWWISQAVKIQSFSRRGTVIVSYRSRRCSDLFLFWSQASFLSFFPHTPPTLFMNTELYCNAAKFGSPFFCSCCQSRIKQPEVKFHYTIFVLNHWKCAKKSKFTTSEKIEPQHIVYTATWDTATTREQDSHPSNDRRRKRKMKRIDVDRRLLCVVKEKAEEKKGATITRIPLVRKNVHDMLLSHSHAHVLSYCGELRC